MDPTHLDAEPRRSPLTFIIAIVCALALTASLFMGYMYLRRRHEQTTRAEQQQAQTQNDNKTVGPLVLQVYEDDAMLRGSQAVIGGTVVNISSESLPDLTVELELRRRSGGGTETRSLPLEPKDLQPQQQGRYSLKVPSRDYSTARIIRIKSKTRADDLGFKTSPGAERPPERPQQPKGTLVVPRPTPRKGDEEFINTPDKPARVP